MSSPAAVVSREDGATVYAGKYCLRGNFDPKTTDPITRKQAATKSAGLADIELAQAGVKERMYVSYWWRLHHIEYYLRLNSAPFVRRHRAPVVCLSLPSVRSRSRARSRL